MSLKFNQIKAGYYVSEGPARTRVVVERVNGLHWCYYLKAAPKKSRSGPFTSMRAAVANATARYAPKTGEEE